MINDPIELERVRIMLRKLAHAACDSYETEYVTMQYKRQLVEMKWFLEDLINDISYFAGEESWQHDRTEQLLKRKEKSQ